MNFRMLLPIVLLGLSSSAFSAGFTLDPEPEMRWVEIQAKDKYERSKAASLGLTIEFVRTGSVWGFATRTTVQRLQQAGFRVTSDSEPEMGRGGHQGDWKDFPPEDSQFHNYAEAEALLKDLAARHSDVARLHSIGKTVEGRNVYALQINSSEDALERGQSNKPGVVFMGAHHAREHLSVEVPLLYAQYLLDHRQDETVARLIDTRDIWVIPMVNPDGAEFDIATGRYRLWRKNRRNNGNNVYGVDLNRNYDWGWGTSGTSRSPSSDVFAGPSAFSEPETQAIKTFVDQRPNLGTMLSYHSFGELVLYPWSDVYDPIPNGQDLATFKKMAETMGSWNKYEAQQSSDLYTSSGDTGDWAYGKHGIFAFTFELSPSSDFGGGFYPGAKMIEKAFNANLKPMLYLTDLADNPHRAQTASVKGMLKNYVEPGLPVEAFYERHPIELFTHEN